MGWEVTWQIDRLQCPVSGYLPIVANLDQDSPEIITIPTDSDSSGTLDGAEFIFWKQPMDLKYGVTAPLMGMLILRHYRLILMVTETMIGCVGLRGRPLLPGMA